MNKLAWAAMAAGSMMAACSGAAPGDEASVEQEAKASIRFDLMHTLPECSHAGHPDTWCRRSDQVALAKLSGMETRVRAILDRAVDPATSKIRIGYFSFSNQSVFDKLCEKGKAGFYVEGFFDQSYRGQMPSKLEDDCQGPEGSNVKMHFLGERSDSPFVWRLHHNKFLFVDPGGSAPVNVAFSSGNLSSFGLSGHFDHWVVMQAPRGSNLVKQSECVYRSMRKALRPQGGFGPDEAVDDPDVYREELDACMATTLFAQGTGWVDAALAKEKIAPLFAPNPADTIARVLVEQIDRVESGGRIYGAMQHFVHAGIARALQRARERGAGVRLVMDDDVITGEGEVPGADAFYQGYLAPKKSGFDVRFLVTNAGEQQMMHNKFLVLEGVDGNKTRVFSGAGHFTTAGMRDNYENFYLTQSAPLSSKYDALFEYMWDRAKRESEL